MEKLRTSGPIPLLLVAPDKLRGTATAREAAEAMAAAATARGWRTVTVPLSDGGEGLLEALGGANRSSLVTGPDGRRTRARWRLHDGVAVVESAEASGLLLAGGAGRNDPLAATSRGTGDLISAALDAGATDVLVGLGGSACTDGGRGALAALTERAGTTGALFGDATVTVCADVEARFLEAAAVFGPQKGATPEQVLLLEQRLSAVRADLTGRFGRDPQSVPGSGAAGGLGGALAVAGARLVGGFDLVAERLGLADLVAEADLVITGEGRLDASSLRGKVVGGVVGLCRAAGTPVVAVVGDREPGLVTDFPVHALTELHGRTTALEDTLGRLAATVDRLLAEWVSPAARGGTR